MPAVACRLGGYSTGVTAAETNLKRSNVMIHAAIALLLLGLASGCSSTAVVPGAPPMTEAVSSAAWEQDMVRFGAEDAMVPPPRGAVLFIGSSSIRLWYMLEADFAEVAVINRGFGGS